MSGQVCDEQPVLVLFHLFGAIIILTMQIGFALLESSAVRNTNIVSILIKNFLDFGISILTYYIVGQAFLHGDSWHGIIGTSGFVDQGVNRAQSWFFFMSFSATTSTIASGTCTERIKLNVYAGLALIMSAFFFPMAGHWVWNSNGFLNTLGFVDLAGASVVHILGGSSGLAATLYLRPRIGKFSEKVPQELDCVSWALTMSRQAFQGDSVNGILGAMILFIAWFGFNCCSSFGFTNQFSTEIEVIATNTALSAGTGLITSYLIVNKFEKYIEPSILQQGMLTGLVAVTGSAHLLSGSGSIILGFLASVLAYKSSHWIKYMKIDDPVDVIPVHLLGGILGTLAPSILGCQHPCSNIPAYGIIYGGKISNVGIQLLGSFLMGILGFGSTFLYFLIVDKVFGIKIRVSALNEILGIDATEHGVDIFKRIAVMEDLQANLRALRTGSNTKSGPTQPFSTKNSTIFNKVHPEPSLLRQQLSPQLHGRNSMTNKPDSVYYGGSIINGSIFYPDNDTSMEQARLPARVEENA